jgi:transketolase
MRNEFINQLLEYARNDSRLMFVTGDLGFGVIEDFQNALPGQFLNTGITEQSSVSYVAGLAKNGFRPFFYSIANFSTFRALEQIRNDVCYMELPVTIVAIGAGFGYGTAGYSHHLIEDFSAMSCLDIDIYTPTMPRDVEPCLQSILQKSRPAYLRLGKGGEKNFGKSDQVFDFPGDYSLIPDTDLTILVNGPIISEVVYAVSRLTTFGNTAAILSCWQSNNFGLKEIDFLKSRKAIFTVEEHVLRGGFGSYISETLGHTSKRVKRIGISKIERRINGSGDFLRESYGLNAEQLLEEFSKY